MDQLKHRCSCSAGSHSASHLAFETSSHTPQSLGVEKPALAFTAHRSVYFVPLNLKKFFWQELLTVKPVQIQSKPSTPGHYVKLPTAGFEYVYMRCKLFKPYLQRTHLLEPQRATNGEQKTNLHLHSRPRLSGRPHTCTGPPSERCKASAFSLVINSAACQSHKARPSPCVWISTAGTRVKWIHENVFFRGSEVACIVSG